MNNFPVPLSTQTPSKPKPDIWFKPKFTWEVKCADISVSPEHRAAFERVEPEKGLALRFPRFLRVRPDKKPEEATTATQALDMYYNQDQIKGSRNGDGEEEDHFGIIGAEEEEDSEDQNAGADILGSDDDDDDEDTGMESGGEQSDDKENDDDDDDDEEE